jgi:hypothetical protein
LTDRLFSPRCPNRDSISLARKITAAVSCDMNSPRENRLDGGDRGDHHGNGKLSTPVPLQQFLSSILHRSPS